MKTIQLKSISLLNFKGIKKLYIKDFEKETNIFGANATGKTTIFDAFTWLLFGKDSTDRTSFEIKTLDENNNVIPQIDHEVEAVILVNGESFNLRRTFREKWQKKRGSLESEFTGNETLFHWNDVPVSAGEFSLKIGGLVNENVFKLITSPTAFNALKWQDQRQALIDISGGVTDESIAEGNADFTALLAKLTNKSIEEYQKQIAASVRKAKDELKQLPTRIDEVERGKPESVDFSSIEKELAAQQAAYTSVETQISDKVAAQQDILNKRSEIQAKIYQLESDINSAKHQARLSAQEEFRKENDGSSQLQTQFTEKESEILRASEKLNTLRKDLAHETANIATLTEQNNDIRSKWNVRNGEEFKMDEGESKCPTCKREFEEEDIEAKSKELFANFQNAKMQDIEALGAKGRRNKERIEVAQKEVVTINERIIKGEEIIDALQAESVKLQGQIKEASNKTSTKTEAELIEHFTNQDESIFFRQGEIEKLKAELAAVKGVDVQDLKDKKDAISQEIYKIKESLQSKSQIAQANTRIAELQKEESTLAQQLADFEKDQYIIENFIKAKIDILESLINNRFEFVNFKLFELQVNGSQVPTCKAMVNGVPIQDVNTAGRINAGLDIISTLCQHYKVTAPIFVDHSESVTNLIPVESQVIKLIVSPSHKKLNVESNKLEKELI